MLAKGVARLKFKRRQLPLPSLTLIPLLPISLLSPLPLPSFLLPLYQLRRLGERCELPQWGLGQSH